MHNKIYSKIIKVYKMFVNISFLYFAYFQKVANYWGGVKGLLQNGILAFK